MATFFFFLSFNDHTIHVPYLLINGVAKKKEKKSLTLLTLDAGNSMGGPDNFSNDGFLGFRLLPIQMLNKNLTPFSNYFQSLLENSSSFHYHYGITPLEDGNKKIKKSFLELPAVVLKKALMFWVSPSHGLFRNTILFSIRQLFFSSIDGHRSLL